MRLTASLLRRTIPLLATASATAALGLVAVVPLAAQAAPAATTTPFYFTTWQLGTPLPTVAAGSTVEAMPNQAGPNPPAGTQLQMTAVSLPASSSQADVASASASATTALAANANANGVVNLVVFTPLTACSPSFNYDEGDAWDDIAQGYNTDAHDNFQFNYTNSVTSTIEVGSSVSDQYGSFSADGTVGVSGGGSEKYPYQIGKSNKVWQTEFDWENLKWTCGHGVFYYTSQPHSWIVSATWFSPGTPAVPPHCGFQRAGTEPTIDTTKAKTISSAFNVLGFGGSSQTGYTTALEFAYYYGENGYMCGDQIYPTQGFDFPMSIP